MAWSRIWWSRSARHFSDRLIEMPTNQQKQLLVFIVATKRNFPQFLPLASHKHVSKSCWRSTAGNWIFHPILSFAGDWIFHLRSCWCSTGLLFICLMSCWWLDTIFSSSVLLVLDGTFVYLFNVVLVARHDVFHLQSCWCSTGLLLISFCLFYEGASTRSRSREKKEICGAILSIGRCWR